MRRGWTSVPVLAMAALALVCAVVATVLLATAGRADATAPDSNTAVVDRTRTAQVIGQVDTDLEHVLTFDYRNPDATRTAAHQALVGEALQQYDVLFTALQSKASAQKLVLTAKVVTRRRDDPRRHARSAARVPRPDLDPHVRRCHVDRRRRRSAITAVEQGGVWRISKLETL